MNDTPQIPCLCAACSGLGCLCGCRQAAAQPVAPTPCGCGSLCQCGPSCTCAKA